MRNNFFLQTIRYTAIGANLIFIIWILFNGMNEGFKGTMVEKASYAALILLLAINSILLLLRFGKKT